MTMLSSPHLDSLPSQPPKDYFEGAEKKLEIEFIVDTSKPDGLRKVCGRASPMYSNDNGVDAGRFEGNCGRPCLPSVRVQF